MTTCLSTPEQETEADRLNRYLETKDPELLAWLFETFNARLVANARKYLQGDDGAEDCVSEAWCALMQTKPPKTKANSAFAYLNTQVRWKIIDYKREMKFERENFVSLESLLSKCDEHGEPMFDIAEVEIEDGEDDFFLQWARVEQQLSTLTKSQRVAVLLYYGDGLTRIEVAQEMGISEAAVANHTWRGMLKLRASLAPVEVAHEPQPNQANNYCLSA